MIEGITSIATDKSKDKVLCEVCRERAKYCISVDTILFTFCEECLVQYLNKKRWSRPLTIVEKIREIALTDKNYALIWDDISGDCVSYNVKKVILSDLLKRLDWDNSVIVNQLIELMLETDDFWSDFRNQPSGGELAESQQRIEVSKGILDMKAGN